MGEFRVVYRTDRFEECCRFYGDVLGWRLTKQWDDPAPGRIFGYGESARIELLLVEPVLADVPAGVYLAVEVDDVAAVHNALVAARIAITQPLADQPWGHRNFAVADPAGLIVVFFEVIA